MNDLSLSNYWFFIEPYVHINVQGNSLLLFNTLSQDKLKYIDNEEIIKIMEELLSDRHNGVIKINLNELKTKNSISFFSDVRQTFMGDLIPVSLSNCRPIQFRREILIEKSIENLLDDNGTLIKEGLDNLEVLRIFINNKCDYEDKFFQHAYKQFPFNIGGFKNIEEIDFSILIEFLDKIKKSSLSRLEFLGGDIFKYYEFNKIATFLNQFTVKRSFYIYYKDFLNSIQTLDLIKSDLTEFNILVNFPIENSIIKSIKNYFDGGKDSYHFSFVIENENEFFIVESLTTDLELENYNISPFYNQDNIDFFKKYVFLNEDNIVSLKQNLMEIKLKSDINRNDFGVLNILYNGDIYANLNNPSIGKLGKDSLYDVLLEELKSGKSWRNIREKSVPCNKCIYNQLCPPISNYEYVFKRTNLCNIK